MLLNFVSRDQILSQPYIQLAHDAVLSGSMVVWHTDASEPIAPNYVCISPEANLSANAFGNALYIASLNIGLTFVQPIGSAILPLIRRQLGYKPCAIVHGEDVVALYAPRINHAGFLQALTLLNQNYTPYQAVLNKLWLITVPKS